MGGWLANRKMTTGCINQSGRRSNQNTELQLKHCSSQTHSYSPIRTRREIGTWSTCKAKNDQKEHRCPSHHSDKKKKNFLWSLLLLVKYSLSFYIWCETKQHFTIDPPVKPRQQDVDPNQTSRTTSKINKKTNKKNKSRLLDWPIV